MQSQFASSTRPNAQLTTPSVDETYSLAGLNLRDPDAIMPPGESPWTINSRMFAREDNEARVSSRMRQGASHLSSPVGSTANVSNVGTPISDLAFTTTHIIAVPITFSSGGAFTRLDTEIKSDGTSSGHVIVNIYTNSGGFPGTLIAESSIYSSGITSTYQYLTSYFIDAPTVTATLYWAVYYIQDNGAGSYYLNQTAAGATQSLSSDNAATSWSNVNSLSRYKTYLSTAAPVKGFNLRYPSTGSNLIMMAQLGSIYSTNKNTGTITTVDSGLSTLAPKVRFEQWDDKTIWVNGVNNARWWDNVTSPVDIPNQPTVPGVAKNCLIWQNRLFLQTDTTRYDFSNLGDPTTYDPVNFFYVPSPKSPDHIAGHIVFQDNMLILTQNSKHTIIGSDISTFTRKEAVGTKGAVSQEAICADHNYVYFMAPDKQIYRYNGVNDQLLSDKVQPELQSISDVSTVRLSIYRNQLRIYYAKAPSPNANMMLMYDLVLQQWFLDTDHMCGGSASLYLDNNELVEFSSLVGRVYYGETQFSDLGKALDYKYWTNYKSYAYRRRTGQTFGGGSAKKRIKRFHPVVRTVDADYTLSVGKDMDFANAPDMRAYIVAGGGAKWGHFVWADGTKWGKTSQVDGLASMSGRGRHIQYRFERKGVETPPEIYGYISQYRVGTQK